MNFFRSKNPFYFRRKFKPANPSPRSKVAYIKSVSLRINGVDMSGLNNEPMYHQDNTGFYR